MTNGTPDSILEMNPADEAAARSNYDAETHPECALCQADVCLVGRSCDCTGEQAGGEAVETNSQDGRQRKVYVHNVCRAEWDSHEKAARALAKTNKERLERLVEQIKIQLDNKRGSLEAGILTGSPTWQQWCEDRARNIVSGLIGELK